MATQKRFILTSLLSLVALSLFVGTLVYFISVPPESVGKIVLLDQPKEITPIDFKQPDGSTKSLSTFQGKWVVLFFGYTSCPDVCPMSLAYANTEWKRLGERQRQVELLFISVDPERDTAENIGRYVKSFNPDFNGLTSEDYAINQLSQQLGVFYRKEPTESALGYLMSHSSDFFIIDPKGRWVGSFRGEREPGALAQHVKSLLKKGGV